MGNFGGHALPGSFFAFYALWITINACIKHNQARRRGSRFISTSSFQCAPFCGRAQHWPVEPVMKIVLVAIGFSLEIITAIHGGKFVVMGNAQHATMFFYFGFSGVIDLLIHYKAPLPPNVDYISLAMAFMTEALLFKFHLHGRSHLDVLIHTLLLYTVYCCIIAVIVEMKYKNSLLSPLSRAYFILLQGTWFWQIGFILYNPAPNAIKWKDDDHDELTLATLLFAWHALADFIVILVCAVLVNIFCRTRGDLSEESGMSLKRLIHAGSNGQSNVHQDSESDLEFEQPVAGIQDR